MSHEFIVEFECPQCGAEASLDETSRVFQCQYCGVKSYLIPEDVFQYVLPGKVPANKEVIYFPFWRFKGVLFSCLSSLSVHSEPVDYLYQAAPSDFFPAGLGFKAHVMKMRFAGPEFKGRIFKPVIPFTEVIEQFKYDYETGFDDEYGDELGIFHSEFIGIREIIYAPYYTHDHTLYDGITNERVDRFDEEMIVVDDPLLNELPPATGLKQNAQFFPTLCPHCGWDMECARDSYLLTCLNCNSFYKPQKGKIQKIGVAFLPAEAETAIYLPFWRLKAAAGGIKLDTYGDLIKTANLIKVVPENDRQRTFHFWIPAFKIASKLFLQIATRVTLFQPHGKLESKIPKDPVYPVNLPVSEILKFPKTLISNFIAFKEMHYPKLEQMEITPKRLALIYLPFQAYGSEFVHSDYKVRVGKQTLEHFRLS